MIQQILDEAVAYAAKFTHLGKSASYIPELAKADPAQLGACIITVDGACYHAGDWHQPFTIQSIAKTVSLILALQTAGKDSVFSKVGAEPTGDSFNSIIKLEAREGRPLNPMINAGAIAVMSCIAKEDCWPQLLSLIRKLCRRETIEVDEAVYRSESATGMRNRSLAYFMQSENLIDGDVEVALDLYFKMCSLSVTTEDLANYGMILANDGIDPATGESIVENDILRIVKTLMVTCGLYDGSGEFAINVGLPSKSGVGGGIVSAAEGKMGIGVFGPSLDSKGNSIGGCRMLEYISKHLNLHYFADHPSHSAAIDKQRGTFRPA